MEPRIVPVKYTTELNFNLESPIRKFTETIDLQVIQIVVLVLGMLPINIIK